MIKNPTSKKTDIASILAEKALDDNTDFWQKRFEETTDNDVEKALSQTPGAYSLDKLAILVSPDAEKYLEKMAQLARQLTIQRFGRTIQLYAPLYLSNYCVNSCRYCGFNKETNFKRTRLTIRDALKEASVLSSQGFRDILLVSSEDRAFITVDYLSELAGKLREKFSSISIEIYQLTTPEYQTLFKAGIEGVTVFQETYNRSAYNYFHKAGAKSDYDNRLNCPDSICLAGMREVGLGVLLGLNDWRTETLALAEHAHYLTKHYWKSRVSFSFPRLKPAHNVQNQQFKHLLSDTNLVQMITALRLCFADAGMTLSTREKADLRDNLIKLGITKISAGSKTCPGGYSGDTRSTSQFEINDNRSPAQFAAVIKKAGLEPVWKNWDRGFIDT